MIRGAVIGAAGVLLLAQVGAAQEAEGRSFSGTVVTGDVPAVGVPVTLHRVTTSGSGSVGEAVSGSAGEFRFPLPPADSAGFEVLFATAEYRSVRHLGPVVHGGAAVEDYRIAVFDTASVIPGAIQVVRRDVVLFPETAGGWEATERILLRNSADRTLIYNDGSPSWEVRLPDGVTDFETGEGELTAAEMTLMGDRLLLLASLTPGDRSLLFRYRIPAELENSRLAIDTPTDTFNIFVNQPAPQLEISGLTTTSVVEVQGERFVQYGANALAAGDEVMLSWEGPKGPPVAPELAGGAAAALVLLIGTWVAARNRAGRGTAAAGAPLPG